MTETFYDLLGVADDATTEEIEAAYREAIKEVHPDVSDDADASERTARLNKAKDVLTDEAERARYDRLGHDAYTAGNAPAGASTGTDGPTGAGGAGETDDSTGTGEPFGGGASGDANGRSSVGGESATEGRRAAGTGANPGGRRARERRQRQRRRERSADRRGRQSTSEGRATGSTNSNASRRQAAAASDGDARTNSSWNAWDTSRAWAVHQDTDSGQGLGFGSVSLSEQSIVLLGSTFFLYPFFVFSAVAPVFPLVARLAVGVCTLLTVMYLLSIPEAAMVIFGIWSVLAPLALVFVPALSVFSLVGLVALSATWVPFGFSVLTFLIVRPM